MKNSFLLMILLLNLIQNSVIPMEQQDSDLESFEFDIHSGKLEREIETLKKALKTKEAQLNQTKRSPRVDYLTLSMRWEPADSKSKLSRNAEFLINGLWANSSGLLLENCKTNEIFQIEKLKPLKSILERYWPSNDQNNLPNVVYWARQWHKYGSCTTQLDGFGHVVSYFMNTWLLFDRFNLFKQIPSFLNRIKPSNSIPISKCDLINAISPLNIRKRSGVHQDCSLQRSVQLVCEKDPSLQSPYLKEIRYCLDTDVYLTPICCPSAADHSCDGDKIFLVSSSPNRSENGIDNSIDGPVISELGMHSKKKPSTSIQTREINDQLYDQDDDGTI